MSIGEYFAGLTVLLGSMGFVATSVLIIFEFKKENNK